jgi:hypothetical protein
MVCHRLEKNMGIQLGRSRCDCGSNNNDHHPDGSSNVIPNAQHECRNSANTTVVVYDIRLQAVKSLPPVVANATERDAKFMSPTQGLQVWRNDLGAVETYFGLYSSSTNPGGRDSAGWYVTNRSSGLVPIQPPTAWVGSGTATASALGEIAFSGASSIQLNGVFTSAYRNYKINFVTTTVTASTVLNYRFTAGGNQNTTLYTTSGAYFRLNGASGAFVTGPTSQGVISWILENNNGMTFEVYNPANTVTTTMTTTANGGDNSTYSLIMASQRQNQNTAFDGIILFPSAGTISGTIQVFGYND